MRSHVIVALATVAVVVTACSSGGGSSASPAASTGTSAAPAASTAASVAASASTGASAEASASSAASPAASGSAASGDAKTATSAAAMGGMEALVAAAKKEGALNVIALPPDWANYGEVVAAFKAKYPEITVNEGQPDANSQQEIDAVKTLAGQDRAPDVLDLGPTVALANTALFAPYQVAAWGDLPADLKEASGLYFPDYTGYMSIGCDSGKVAMPATVKDLLKPEYKGKIALNGDPTAASAGFNGVVMASLANGGSADDISKGVDFFKQLNDAGNLLPVDPTPATIASGQTPCVIDWEYNNAAQTDTLKGKIDWKVIIPSDAPPVASYYNQAITKDAPHPAAARLWEEFLFTPEAQNLWLKGYARPVLLEKMTADKTVDETLLGKLAESTGTRVQLNQEQLTKAQDYLKTNWNITIQ
jgi:putative spermidine/putrescine transport system substrate-binding protein